jgi:hypothetical protein
MQPAELTQRQADILALTAADQISRVFPEGSIPSKAYRGFAQMLSAKLGDWTADEYAEASAIAMQSFTPMPAADLEAINSAIALRAA